MSHFAIIDLTPTDNNCVENIAPLDVQTLQLAHPGDVPWELCEVRGLFRLKDDDPFFASLLPQKISRLLESGLNYPPALALAIEKATVEFLAEEKRLTKTRFTELLEMHLNAFLSKQVEDPYVFAQVVRTGGGAALGAFYWILGYDDVCERVEFVSRYWYIYDEPVSLFDIKPEKLKQLPRVRL